MEHNRRFIDDEYTCFYCHTSYEKDLQLAAELGKTLLERNKELETNLRQQQNVVEDRNQEIEYLTKQTAALREVNDSRLRIYEQLEISIQDLERNNQRLVQENANDKKQIKSLYETIESLESRCEDLQHLVDDMGHTKKDNSLVSEDSFGESAAVTENQDEYTKLVSQLEHANNQRAKEQRKVSELEQNVSILIQENSNLEEKVCAMQQKDQELKTLQDQIVYLEEIRQGNLCRRCQRSTDPNLYDEYSVYDDDDDTDDISAIGSYVETHKHEVLQQLQETLGENYSEDNPYRILVDKYEALLKIQQQKHNALTSTVLPSVCGGGKLQHEDEPHRQQNHGMSLHEELQNLSGTFSSFNGNASDSEDGDDDDDNGAAAAGRRAALAGSGAAAAGCKYSETETTSSSGFSDETSNKGTQTETSFFTGSFLCTISDGDDCRFSIYDDASPVESRFRNTPVYRPLFREIFAVLKRAAEAKDEGERLPLLQDDDDDDGGGGEDDEGNCGGEDNEDDSHGAVSAQASAATVSGTSSSPPPPPRVPPATPACEHNPFAESAVAAAESAIDEEPVVSVKELLRLQTRREEERAAPKQQQQQAARRQRDIIEELASVNKHGKNKHSRHRKSASASSRQQSSRDISHLMRIEWTDKTTPRRHRRTAADDGTVRDGSRSPRRGEEAASSQPPSDRSPPAADPSAHHHRRRGEYYPSSVASQMAQLKLLEKSYAEALRETKLPQTPSQQQQPSSSSFSSSNCRPQSRYRGKRK